MKQLKLFLVLSVLIPMLVEYIAPSIKAQTQSYENTCVTKTQFYTQDLTFSPDSKYLAASWDEKNGIARVWNVETGEVAHTLSNNYQAYSLGRYAFSSDGKYLLTSSIIIVLWDLQTGRKIYEIQSDGEPYGETADKIIISPDDKYFLLTSNVGTRLYDFATGKQLNRFMVSTFQLATFSRDGRYILMQDGDKITLGGVVLWDIQVNKKVHTFGEQHIVYASFVDDDQYIATIDPYESNEYVLWNTLTYQQVLTADLGDGNNLLGVQFSSDGKLFVTQNILWDALTGQPIATLNSFVETFLPDSRNILIRPDVSGSSDRQVYRIWNIGLKIEKGNFSLDPTWYTMGISPDSNYLATGSENGELRLWDTLTGQDRYLDC